MSIASWSIPPLNSLPMFNKLLNGGKSCFLSTGIVTPPMPVPKKLASSNSLVGGRIAGGGGGISTFFGMFNCSCV